MAGRTGPKPSSVLDDVRQVARGWRWGRRPLVPASAEPWAPVRERRVFPTDWARTPLARATREAILSYGFRSVVWSQTEPAVHGLDHLEDLSPPVMFVANHSSHMDTPLILCALPKSWRDRTAVAAAADYFFDVWWRAASTALVFNTFPIERTGGRRATDTARRLVNEGWSLVVYPEGTRSKDGWVSRFRSGAARLCDEFDIPAVPVALRGTFAAMPRGRSWPLPGRPSVSVRFGRPIRLEDGEEIRSFSHRMQHELARLWDEDATDWYASLRREAEGATPAMSGPHGPRWRRVWDATRLLDRPGPARVWRRR
jgi:1-acyl-sn-glycerol-3-phosphate acyltransferase